MNQETLLSIIAHGENSTVEFKRELNLENSQQKAEFVKDIIALANSASENGRMLVGVSNDKTIAGISHLEEERIQEVIQTYINPPLNVICHFIDALNVGIIEVLPKQKPYKVSRAIERLERNQVFIRHGSVVMKASPEEIILMDKDSQIRSKSSQYINAARKHIELGNFESAVRAYTELIDIYPEQAWLLERANTYVNLVYVAKEEQIKDIPYLLLKDFEDALVLSNSPENEKMVRFARLRAIDLILNKLNKEHDLDLENIWSDDIQWLKERVSGIELGEILFLELEIKIYATWFIELNYYEILEKAIDLGYNDKRVYFLRALIDFMVLNYSYAQTDIEKYLDQVTGKPITDADKDEKAKALCLKGEILFRLQDYISSYNCFEQARRVSKKQ